MFAPFAFSSCCVPLQAVQTCLRCTNYKGALKKNCTNSHKKSFFVALGAIFFQLPLQLNTTSSSVHGVAVSTAGVPALHQWLILQPETSDLFTASFVYILSGHVQVVPSVSADSRRLFPFQSHPVAGVLSDVLALNTLRQNSLVCSLSCDSDVWVKVSLSSLVYFRSNRKSSLSSAWTCEEV